MIIHYPNVTLETYMGVLSIRDGVQIARKDKNSFGCRFVKRPYVLNGKGKRFYDEDIPYGKIYLFGKKLSRKDVEELNEISSGKYDQILSIMKEDEFIVETRVGVFQRYSSDIVVVKA